MMGDGGESFCVFGPATEIDLDPIIEDSAWDNVMLLLYMDKHIIHEQFVSIVQSCKHRCYESRNSELALVAMVHI